MQDFWTKIASSYWFAIDLEEKQRLLLADFLEWKKWLVLELACGNGKVIEDIYKKNNSLEIVGIDYNESMIEVAKNRIPGAKFIVGDILNIDSILWQAKFDYVVCLNSLHNLPNKKLIYDFFIVMQDYVKDDGYIIFDIRNEFNLGVNYGYWKNRKNGLQFHTLNIFSVFKKFNTNFNCVMDIWITYSSIQETWNLNMNFFKKILYQMYLYLIRIKIFSPYRFLVFHKK